MPDVTTGHFCVRPCGAKGLGVVATKVVRPQRVLLRLIGREGDDRATSDFALQIGQDRFLESQAGLDDYLNHACDPNAWIDWSSMALRARRRIVAGEEVTIDYNTSEWDLTIHVRDLSFNCLCGEPRCVGRVAGFSHLPARERSRRRDRLSPFLRTRDAEYSLLLE